MAAIQEPWNALNYSERIWRQRDTLIIKLEIRKITRSLIAQEASERTTERISQAFNTQTLMYVD